ncbi:uncharacterized [Tachysurus ichikawai]
MRLMYGSHLRHPACKVQVRGGFEENIPSCSQKKKEEDDKKIRPKLGGNPKKTNNGLERLNVHLAQIIDQAQAKEFLKPVQKNPRFALYLGVFFILTTFPVIRSDFYSRNSVEALTLASLQISFNHAHLKETNKESPVRNPGAAASQQVLL